MLYFKDTINLEQAKDFNNILTDIDKFKFIIKTFFTYDALFKDFENKSEIIQDIILEDFGDFKKISNWTKEKNIWIEKIEEDISFMTSRQLTEHDKKLRYKHIQACYNSLFFHFRGYSQTEIIGYNTNKIQKLKRLMA